MNGNDGRPAGERVLRLLKFPFVRRRWAAMVAFVFVYLAFTPLSIAPLLLVAPVFLLYSVRAKTFRQGMISGYLFGLLVEGFGFYWITNALDKYAFGPATAWPVFFLWLVLAALLWALWGGLATIRGGWAWNLAWPAVTLTFLELVYPRLFPWNLGSAFLGWDAITVTARDFSVLGLTGLLLLWGGGVLESMMLLTADRRRAVKGLLIAFICLGGWIGLGSWRLADDPELVTVRMGFVQPCVPLKSRSKEDLEKLSALPRDTRRLLAEGADVVVWSEGISRLLLTEKNIRREGIDRWFEGPVIMGGSGIHDPGDGSERRSTNRMSLVHPRGTTTEFLEPYDKRELLMFGEFVPCREWIEMIVGEVPITDMHAGTGIPVWPFEVGDQGKVVIGPSICYEGILAGIGDELRDLGATLHVNATEDGWFGQTRGPHLHLGLQAMRAAEAGLPLMRVTNFGVSAWVDHNGTIRKQSQLYQEQSGIFEVEVPRDRVEIPAWRSLFEGLFVIGFPLLSLIGVFRRRTRSEPETPRS